MFGVTEDFLRGDGGGRAGSGKGLAIRHSGDVLLGGASGAGSLLLNTKASREAVCSRAPAAIVPSQEPESRDAGVSRFRRIGSHPAEADAAESPAGHADGPGSSEFTKNGSHPAEADFSDEPEAVLWRRPPPHRAVQNQAFCRTWWPRRTVRYRKRPCGVREVHLSAGAARGGGSSAGATESWAIGGWWLRDWAAGGR